MEQYFGSQDLIAAQLLQPLTMNDLHFAVGDVIHVPADLLAIYVANGTAAPVPSGEPA